MCIDTAPSRVFHGQSLFIQHFKKDPTIIEHKFIAVITKVHHWTPRWANNITIVRKKIVMMGFASDWLMFVSSGRLWYYWYWTFRSYCQHIKVVFISYTYPDGSTDSSVSMVITLQAEWLRSRDLIPNRCKRFFWGSEAHTASYIMDTRDYFLEDKVKGAKVNNGGAIPSLPYMP
jgi:hypothetical protein